MSCCIPSNTSLIDIAKSSHAVRIAVLTSWYLLFGARGDWNEIRCLDIICTIVLYMVHMRTRRQVNPDLAEQRL